MRYLKAILLLSILFSCSTRTADSNDSSDKNQDVTSDAKIEDLKRALTGEWRNVSMKINITSLNNTSRDSVTDVPEGQWETILKIKPIRTNFKEDGTFRSEYRNLADSIVFVSEGTWLVTGDSLSMTESGNTSSYFLLVSNGRAEFTGYIDWDQDGEADDLYFGIQEKF